MNKCCKTASILALNLTDDRVFIKDGITLINGEAIEEMSLIKKESINCIVCDLPYGSTKNSWDSILPLNKMWKQFNRILVKGGSIILTASQPFTSILVVSIF